MTDKEPSSGGPASEMARHHHGHRRMPTVGKAMPVTSLLLQFPTRSGHGPEGRESHLRGGESERPPIFFSIDGRNDARFQTPPSPTQSKIREEPLSESIKSGGLAGRQGDTLSRDTVDCKVDEDDEESVEEEAEQDYELLVSECSSDAGGDTTCGHARPANHNADDNDKNPEHGQEEEYMSLIGNSVFYTPCLTCTGQAPLDLAARPSALNEMCRRLCTDECRLRLSLAGLEPPPETALRSKQALEEHVRETVLQRPALQHTCSEDTLKGWPTQSTTMPSVAASPPAEFMLNPSALPPPSRIAIQRKQFLTDLLNYPSSDSDSDSDTDAEGGELLRIVASIMGPSLAAPRAPPPSPTARQGGATTQNAPDTQTTVTSDVADVADAANDAATVNATNTHEPPCARAPVDAHELAMLKDFREKFAIAEALAKTSAMTSTPQMRQRLAARKLEMELDGMNGGDGGSDGSDSWGAARRATSQGTPQPEPTAGSDGASKGVLSPTTADALQRTKHENGSDIDDDDSAAEADSLAADKAAAAAHAHRNEFEPSRELLLYLVSGMCAPRGAVRQKHTIFVIAFYIRQYLKQSSAPMGSFNSAPKINNLDSQDDALEIPKGLNSTELLQHVRNLRGENQPPLLARYFRKPNTLAAAQFAASDVTDALSYLKLNSMYRDAVNTPANQIRLLQWNILSQTLGQSNDGFVCCPEEALTWENRKYLIVQEILQHNPDVVCLQEVDHFKFLQNILGSQNYEGIFYPKPDSPCLYIEENNGPDGCAIFYRRDKLDLKSYDTRILEVWRVQSNQVAIAANFTVKSTGQEFCVCTTHLKARHGSLLSKLRNEQGRDLIRFVKQFSANRPVLLCGDFNAEPIEPVYSTVLSCDFLKLSSAYAEIQASKNEAKCSEPSSDSGESVLPEENIAEKVQKSIEHEPPYTTWKIREDGEECHTIDYVFYTDNDFKVKNCLEFPQGEDIGKNRTPSFQYPSDHFSLVCDFEIVADGSKSKCQ